MLLNANVIAQLIRVCDGMCNQRTTPPEKTTGGKTSSQSTESGAGESGLCCWIAAERLAQKGCSTYPTAYAFLTETGILLRACWQRHSAGGRPA